MYTIELRPDGQRNFYGQLFLDNEECGSFQTYKNICTVLYYPIVNSDVFDKLEFTFSDSMDIVEKIKDLVPLPIAV